MMLEKKILGVIPARGGSKGVKNKNITSLNGKPLIAYTIDAAKKSKLLTHAVVSTDNTVIASVAKKYGGDVPFMRPSNLATDSAPSAPVVAHALQFMEEHHGLTYDAIMLLQPTTPLRLASDIDRAIELWLNSDSDSLVSVVNVGAEHPLRMKRIVGERLVNYIDQGMEDMRPRQELPAVYIRNGAIYLTSRELFVATKSLVGEDVVPYIMPEERSVNIDASKDLFYADYLLSI